MSSGFNYSRAALLRFLDYLSSKGLMNPNTAGARKQPVTRYWEILDDDEARDVRLIDLDGLIGRFQNLKGSGYTPDSLGNYKSRDQNSD